MNKTLENLTKAYIGECQARNRYDFYSKIAKKEGFEQISEIFSLTAEQEKVHAKRLYEHIQELKENEENIVVEVPAVTIYGDTKKNLESAIEGESHEFEEMYPEFAKTAAKEGFPLISNRLNSIAIAEKNHKERFEFFLENINKNEVFQKSGKVWWVCRECGFIHYGEKAPEKCPSCDHPQAYYQLR